MSKKTKFKSYGNPEGNSGIDAYQIGPDFIRVKFHNGSIYLYTYESAGQDDIEEMKELAKEGQGLNRYINTNVRHHYAARER